MASERTPYQAGDPFRPAREWRIAGERTSIPGPGEHGQGRLQIAVGVEEMSVPGTFQYCPQA